MFKEGKEVLDGQAPDRVVDDSGVLPVQNAVQDAKHNKNANLSKMLKI